MTRVTQQLKPILVVGVLWWCLWNTLGLIAQETTPEPVSTMGVTPSPTIEPTYFATVVPTQPTSTNWLSGQIHYQAMVSQDHSGIEVAIYSIERVLLTQTLTTSDGSFLVQVPVNSSFWLVANAVHYQQVAIGVAHADEVIHVTLAVGDLDEDECVTEHDLTYLLSQMGTMNGDLNGDNLTDTADLALLTGNLRDSCEVFTAVLPVTFTPTPIASILPEPESTAEVIITPENTASVEVTVLPESTPEVTPLENQALMPTISATPVFSPTVDASPTSTISLTPTSEATSTEVVVPSLTFTPTVVDEFPIPTSTPITEP